MKLLFSFGIIFATAYLLLCLLIYLRQEGMIYYPDMPSRQLEASPADIDLRYEEVRLTTTDGIDLHGWYIPAKAGKVSLIFCHGNAGNISHRLDSIQLFHRMGLNVLVFDYRGYGQSEGKPSEQGSYADVRAAWHYLTKERQIPPEQIVLFGRSLGAAVASRLATEVKPAAVILESAFASVPQMAKSLLPFFPVRWLSSYRYSNVDHVQQITVPLLVVHSEEDEIIPYTQGRMVYKQANEPKSFLNIHGGHNDGFILSGAHYINGLKLFLQKHITTYKAEG